VNNTGYVETLLSGTTTANSLMVRERKLQRNFVRVRNRARSKLRTRHSDRTHVQELTNMLKSCTSATAEDIQTSLMKNKNKDDTWAHNTSLMNEDKDYMDIQTDRLLMIYNNIHDRISRVKRDIDWNQLDGGG
jgi:hypothetical protein